MKLSIALAPAPRDTEEGRSACPPFGCVNLMFTWLHPLDDDTPGALLRFHAPMFLLWTLASFRAAQHSGRLLSGVTTGTVVAFATFCVFDVFDCL